MGDQEEEPLLQNCEEADAADLSNDPLVSEEAGGLCDNPPDEKPSVCLPGTSCTRAQAKPKVSVSVSCRLQPHYMAEHSHKY